MIMIMEITETSYDITGLTPGTSYNLTINSSNMDGSVESVMMISIPNTNDILPSYVTNLKNTTNSEDTITVTWNNASSPYCGGVLYYIVIISPDERNGSNIMDIANVTDLSLLTATFSNLINDTYYDISVTPYNRVDAGIGVTANIRTSSPVPTQSNNATIPSITPTPPPPPPPPPCFYCCLICWIIIIVVIAIIIMIIHTPVGVILHYYYLKCEEKHPTMTQLLEVMRIKDIGIAVKWFDLGLELVNDSNILQQIRDDDAHTCCRMMFQKWLESIPDASWNHLVAALNKIGMDSAANVVSEQFISEHPNESKIRLVLLVILGVSTLSISNLIWYIYLKCQSEKDKAKCRSLLFVSLIVSYILSAGLSTLLWCLIHQCCFKKKKDTGDIPLNSVKPETCNTQSPWILQHKKSKNEEPTDEYAQASKPAPQQQQQANQKNEGQTDEYAQVSKPTKQQQQQQAKQKNEGSTDEYAQVSKPAKQKQEAAKQKNERPTDEYAQVSKPAKQKQEAAKQKVGVINYADLNIQKGPKRFGDADHDVQYGKVAETKQ